jgi:hypothetical protein
MNKFQNKNKQSEKPIMVVGILKYVVSLNIPSCVLPPLFSRINGSIPSRYNEKNVALPKWDNIQATMNRMITLDQPRPRFMHNTRKQYSVVIVKIDDNEKGENHLGK